MHFSAPVVLIRVPPLCPDNVKFVQLFTPCVKIYKLPTKAQKNPKTIAIA
jgi:hypothetical protein